jgi:pimeloyl-ACP methyl ester carboxylesterase
VVRWWPLGVATVAVVALALVGILPRWPGLVHAVAVPPLDAAFDLRVLVARASSYPVFLLGAAISVAVRTVLLGLLLWTVGAATSAGSGMARAARLYLVVVVPLAVAGALDFAGLAALYSWYGWAGLGLTVLVAVALIPRTIPPRGARIRRFPTAIAYLLVLVALGALADLVGASGAIPAVVVSAVLTAAAVGRLVRPGPYGRATLRGATASALVVLAALLPSVPVTPSQVVSDSVLLIVPGVDTSSGQGAGYRLDPEALGFPCDRVYYYSYRGPGDGAPPGDAPCPIRVHRPYTQTATQQPLGVLVDLFGQQVTAIRAEAGDAPLVVVTHSQGAVIAWRAVAQGLGGVSHLVALAGFPHSAVGYPPPGENGPGRVGADALRALSWFSRFLGIGTFDPDAPLAREILARPNGLESVFGAPLPSEVTAALVFATGDLVAAPEGHDLSGGFTSTVDTTHVRIPVSGPAEAAIQDVLAGRSPGSGSPVALVLAPALPAWLPPPTGA